jgi:heme O synthase-like polyprenyltransferase
MLISTTLGAEFTRARGHAADFISLTKPRILMMVLLTTCTGFYLGSGSTPGYGVLWQVLAGTALAAGGTLALNQFLERDLDARMTRTQLRPLPAGRLQPAEALLFGVLLTVAGLLYLAVAVNTWCSGGGDRGKLSVSVHAAEAQDCVMRCGGSGPRGVTAGDRLGGGHGKAWY